MLPPCPNFNTKHWLTNAIGITLYFLFSTYFEWSFLLFIFFRMFIHFFNMQIPCPESCSMYLKLCVKKICYRVQELLLLSARSLYFILRPHLIFFFSFLFFLAQMPLMEYMFVGASPVFSLGTCESRYCPLV